MNDIRLETVSSVKKILIKIGSAVLTGSDGLDLKSSTLWCRTCAI